MRMEARTNGAAWTRVALLIGGLVGVVVGGLAGCTATPRAPDAARAEGPVSTPLNPETGAAQPWTERTIARSLEGRAVVLREVGSGPRRVLVLAGIHGNEPEGGQHVDELCARLAASAASARATFWVVPAMNPDGLANGTRGNARGVDLNRNWPARNFRPDRSNGPFPLSEPEAGGVADAIESVEPELIVVFHSTATGPFVDPDGPERAERIGAAFADAAAALDDRWRLLPNYTNPPGSLGTALGIERQTPVLTIEFERGHDARAATEAAVAGVLAATAALAGERL